MVPWLLYNWGHARTDLESLQSCCGYFTIGDLRGQTWSLGSRVGASSALGTREDRFGIGNRVVVALNFGT